MACRSRFTGFAVLLSIFSVLSGVVALPGVVAQTEELATEWTIEGIALPADGDRFFLADINDSGRIVGALYSNTTGETPILIRDLEMRSLGPEGVQGTAYAISEDGVVVGYQAVDNFTGLGVQFRTGEVIDLGLSSVGDINDGGVIAGASPENMAATLVNGEITVLPTLPDATQSSASGINNEGWVVGESVSASGSSVAVLWRDGEIVDLGAPAGDRLVAQHVNEDGLIVGFSYIGATNEFVGWTWQVGTVTPLDVGEYANCMARQSNETGTVVGNCVVAATDDTPIAVVWHNGELIDLNSLLPADSGWVLNEAQAINSQGQIIGHGTLDGAIHAFVMSPVS